MREQLKELAKGCDVLMATPGRWVDTRTHTRTHGSSTPVHLATQSLLGLPS